MVSTRVNILEVFPALKPPVSEGRVPRGPHREKLGIRGTWPYQVQAPRRARSSRWRPTVSAPGMARSLLRDEGADSFPEDDAAQVVRFEKIENDDRHLVVHAERKGGGIHHGQLADERFLVGDLRETLGVGILVGIRVVDAVHFGGFED